MAEIGHQNGTRSETDYKTIGWQPFQFISSPIQNSKVIGERFQVQGLRSLAFLSQSPTDSVLAVPSRHHLKEPSVSLILNPSSVRHYSRFYFSRLFNKNFIHCLLERDGWSRQPCSRCWSSPPSISSGEAGVSRAGFREHEHSISRPHFSVLRLIKPVECLDLRE